MSEYSAGSPPGSDGHRRNDFRGHRCVLESLYVAHAPGLRAYLERRVDRAAAEDLLQETFLRAAQSAQLGHLVNPGGFLCKIARNLLVDHARRASARPTYHVLDPDACGACAPEQEAVLEASQLGVVVDRAIADLPPKTRRVFEMSRIEERCYREIHEELGISQATVEYHMMRAVARLRAIIADAA